MNLGEVKQLLYETVVKYHPGAMVVWEKTKGVTPKPPYITLGYSNLNRSLFFLTDDEEKHKYYNYSFTFEINLYAVGKSVKDNAGKVIYYENTAVEDLNEFVCFLNSEEMTNELANKNVTIVVNSPIRDMSELIGDTKFNYRSMVEATVSFSGEADGPYGISSITAIPNSSGGGTPEMAEADIYYIKEVEISEEE